MIFHTKIAKKLMQQRRGHLLGHIIYAYDTCSSTNTLARQMVEQGAREGTVVIASHQQDGRGRAGRHWVTSRGNLAFSLILEPLLHQYQLGRLTMVLAFSVYELCKDLGAFVTVKWPNDILLQASGKKISGILVESLLGSSREKIICIAGIGINLHHNSESDGILTAAACLEEEGIVLTYEDAVLRLLDRIENNYAVLQSEEKWKEFFVRYKAACCTLGRYIKINEGEKFLEGYAKDLREDGALVLWIEGRERLVYAGEEVVS